MLPVELLVENFPDKVPTVIVEPVVAATDGFFSFTLPAPVLSVVTWPTTVPPIETSSVVLAARPVTVRDSDVLPLSVFDRNVADPVALPAESVSSADNVVW